METLKHRITDAECGICRLDKYISDHLNLFSRSQVKLRVTKAFVNGSESKFSSKVKAGDLLEIYYSQAPLPDILPEKIPLDILYEDENVIVVNKLRGMIVHPAGGIYSGTLVNALLNYYKTLESNFSGEPLRPGIVHRLDKDTSGALIVAKNTASHKFLSDQFKLRNVGKLYWAVVKGAPPVMESRIETKIARDPGNRKRFTWRCEKGKAATTDYSVLRRLEGYSVLALKPLTGRTHQLRVHCLSMGCPVLGDRIYGRKDNKFPDAPLMLHARSISLRLPERGEDRRTFEAPPPRSFRKYLYKIRFNNL